MIESIFKRLPLSRRLNFDIFTIYQYLIRIYTIYLQYSSSIEFKLFIALIIYKFQFLIKMYELSFRIWTIAY